MLKQGVSTQIIDSSRGNEALDFRNRPELFGYAVRMMTSTDLSFLKQSAPLKMYFSCCSLPNKPICKQNALFSHSKRTVEAISDDAQIWETSFFGSEYFFGHFF